MVPLTGSPKSGNIPCVSQAPAKSASVVPSHITDKIAIATGGVMMPTAFTQALYLRLMPTGSAVTPVVVPAKQPVALPSLVVKAQPNVVSSSSSSSTSIPFDQEYAVVKNGTDASAQYEMGQRCLCLGKKDEGIACLEKAADQQLDRENGLAAILALIEIYFQDLSYRDANGKLVNEENYLSYLARASMHYQHSKSQFTLGTILEVGCETTPQNLELAQQYYQRVLKADDASLWAKAQERLNVLDPSPAQKALGISNSNEQDPEGKAPLGIMTNFDSNGAVADENPVVDWTPQPWTAAVSTAVFHESKQPADYQDSISTSSSSTTTIASQPSGAAEAFKARLIEAISKDPRVSSCVNFEKWISKMKAEFPGLESFSNWGVPSLDDDDRKRFRIAYPDAYYNAIFETAKMIFIRKPPSAEPKMYTDAANMGGFIEDLCKNLVINFDEVSPDSSVTGALMTFVRNQIKEIFFTVEGVRDIREMLPVLGSYFHYQYRQRIMDAYENAFNLVNARHLEIESQKTVIERERLRAASQPGMVRSALGFGVSLLKGGASLGGALLSRLNPSQLFQGSGATTEAPGPSRLPEPDIDRQ